MQRLGLNKNCYCGETIEIDCLLTDISALAEKSGWDKEVFASSNGLELFALHRATSGASKNIYISTGIHGDEPAGPLAIASLLKQNRWSQNANLYLCPCLNPTGYRLNRRENARGIDLNREYRDPTSEEIISHIAWLVRQPRFDLALCLHEDWESHGFYVYELNPDHLPSLAETMIREVAKVCPIDRSESIEGRPASGGIVRPHLDPKARPDWPEAFYLISHQTRLSYTLEAPSDYPLETRVNALITGVQAVFDAVGATWDGVHAL
jgi:murein peptide amidase A